MADLSARGWARFAHEPEVEVWARAMDSATAEAAADPANKQWLRCGGTWFVGVDIGPNDAAGRVTDGPPLTGAAIEAARAISAAPLHAAQISEVRPGYPAQGAEEGAAAFAYRRDRDAAHVDGLHRIMPGRRRKLLERHAWILGYALTEAPADAAPLTVWEGSVGIMRAALGEALAGHTPSDWAGVDLTEVYQAARRRCFDSCARVEVALRPGEAVLVHRLALHGVAPWRAPDGPPRKIAYFRPDPGGHDQNWWISAP